MNSEELQKTLMSLQLELSGLKEVDAETQQRLRQVVADIQRLAGPVEGKVLGEGGAGSVEGGGSSVTESLEGMVVRFESRHPQLTTLMQQLIDRLTEIGI